MKNEIDYKMHDSKKKKENKPNNQISYYINK